MGFYVGLWRVYLIAEDNLYVWGEKLNYFDMNLVASLRALNVKLNLASFARKQGKFFLNSPYGLESSPKYFIPGERWYYIYIFFFSEVMLDC